MERLFKIYKELHDAGVKMSNEKFEFSNGAPAVVIEQDKSYGLFIDTSKVKTFRQEIVVAAHEWAHITTGSTHHINSSREQIEKDERRARRAMIERLVPLEALRLAAASGCEEPWQFAEYLDLPEALVCDARDYWVGARGEHI